MPAPVPLAGVDITADAGTYMVPAAAFKTADQSVTSSIVLVSDTQLFVAVAANSVYEIDLELFFLPINGTATPGITFAWSAPASATFFNRWLLENAVGSAASVSMTSLAGTPSTTVTAASAGVAIAAAINVHGMLTTSAAAGTLQFQWCQGVSSATPTVVKAGSFLVARRIA